MYQKIYQETLEIIRSILPEYYIVPHGDDVVDTLDSGRECLPHETRKYRIEKYED